MRRAIVTARVAPVFGSLQRQEDVRPRLVVAELRDLALDPDGGEAPEVHPDPSVESGDGEDLAVAVEEVLDLRHVARLSSALRSYTRRCQREKTSSMAGRIPCGART